ncbi:sugar-binding domain-containing protein, partial [Escherichia coli]|uniref:sugar-binding domain-containing protein n=1 Tax=Escherichia coli TaxID=562 RepID=UPI001BDCD37F
WSTSKTPSYTKSVSWQHHPIGIAMSEEKYSGIVGALRGKYINCLVTNSSTAELLLK